MAEERKLTKKERRAKARAERKRQEAEEAKKARRQRWTTYGVTALVIAFVAWIVWTADPFGGGETVAGETLSVAAYEEARQSAGCEVVSDEALPNANHVEPATAPPASTLYAGAPRPTHSGPHYATVHPVVQDGFDSQAEERALTHNLEHGAVIVWYDPEQVDSIGTIEDWAEGLNQSGFAFPNSGGAVFVSPYTDPGISSGKPLALRAWGIAVDCDSWDETVGNGFVIEHFGTHGISPENRFSPYPEDVLAFSDREIEDNPQGGTETHAPAPTDTGEPSPTES